VNSLYSNVLGRSADSSGLNAWVNAIETRAMTLGQVASAIVNSPEAATSPTSILVKDSFPVLASGTMTGLYQTVLGRTPDVFGMASGTAALRNGVTVAQLTTFLVTSPEYVLSNVTVGATNIANETQYVDSLYRTVLGRAADTGGLNFWANAIDTHALTISQVASAIVNSSEAATSASSILSNITL